MRWADSNRIITVECGQCLTCCSSSRVAVISSSLLVMCSSTQSGMREICNFFGEQGLDVSVVISGHKPAGCADPSA